MSDVTRWGPAWMWTTATRPSTSTLVTMPGKRLRADSTERLGLRPRRGLGKEAGELRALHHPFAPNAAVHVEAAGVGPAADGVGADAEKFGGLAHPVRRHTRGQYGVFTRSYQLTD
jgi:hypothetical protein